MSHTAAGVYRGGFLTLNLLFDLDDTLLKNNFDEFLPHYLDAFSKTVASVVEPELFVRTLLAATEEMFNNRQPDCTLREVFEASFFPPLGIEKERFFPFAEEFYSNIFPNLKRLTEPKPEAVKLVNQALERGYSISISTNPLFPISAIEQRLDWANLPPSKYRYELISSYEEFHFVKPNPTYFAEFLARIGWPTGPVIAVGDDLERDIRAARRLGLATYWVNPHSEGTGVDNPLSHPGGKLSEFIHWLDGNPPEILDPDFSSPEAMLAILRSTPAALGSISAQISSASWNKRPQPLEWSLTEIICHLRDVDHEVNIPRLDQLRGKKNPFISGIDTDRWAEERVYRNQDGASALQEFIVFRLELLQILESLTQDEWNLPARHAIFGPTNLTEMVNIIASHDRLHIRQVKLLIDNIERMT